MDQSEIERLLVPYPDMLTVEEVATVLRVHRRSVQRWASQGRFTAIRLGAPIVSRAPTCCAGSRPRASYQCYRN